MRGPRPRVLAGAGLLACLVAARLSAQINVATVADRDRVQVGEEVTLSLRATSSDPAGGPLRVVLPPGFDGFDILSRNELSEMGADGSRRLMILELKLRAAQPGTWRLWPIRVEQGFQVVVAPSVTVEVSGGAEEAAALARRNPRIARLLERAPPPRRGDVAVSTAVSMDTAYAGQQVDLATAAWFPRATLSRLRRPPTLKPPTVSGVWSLPQATSPGVIASRVVDGEWYDLFVSHQVFFPLTTGRIAIPPAVLTFAVPTGPQYFSEERTYELASEPTSLEVLPAPTAPGVPVARELRLRYEIPRTPSHAGDLLSVAVEVRGAGNVALWPAPVIAWPDGVRAYPERTEEETSSGADGAVGGSKRFRFLVLPDSAGPLVLPEVAYPYFDPIRRANLTATARSVVVPVIPGDTRNLNRPALPLAVPIVEPPLARLWRITPAWMVAVAGLLPMALWCVMFLRGRRQGRPAPAEPVVEDPEAALQRWVRATVPMGADLQPHRLIPALRRRGVPREEAEAVARVWEAVRRAEYGPHGPQGDERTEVTRLLQRVSRFTGVAGLLCAGLTFGARAQVRSPADLYASGQFRAASAEYLRRAEQVPSDPWRWYAAAVSAYAAGDDAASAASFLRARRLAPRDPSVRTGWQALVMAVPNVTRAAQGMPGLPVAPSEMLVLALFGWVVGGSLVAVARTRTSRLRSAGAAILAAAAVLALVGWGMGRAQAQPSAVVARAVSLRAAPHGLASDLGRLDQYQHVPVLSRDGAWRLVEGVNGRAGWVPADALVEIAGLH